MNTASTSGSEKCDSNQNSSSNNHEKLKQKIAVFTVATISLCLMIFVFCSHFDQHDNGDWFVEEGHRALSEASWTGKNISTDQSDQLTNQTKRNEKEKKAEKPLKILYIITSLAEYNNGRRGTSKGSDRLQNTLIPVMKEGVLSMIGSPYHYKVDVFLICHWIMQPERLQLIRDALPSTVGLQYWDDATPLSYVIERDSEWLRDHTRGLARQHRFVIKDKLPHYDFFVNFEDDMLIKGPHVHFNLKISNELYRLRDVAPNITRDDPSEKERTNNFYGQLNKQQLTRMMPGFMRVEVLLDEDNYGTQSDLGPIPVDLNFTHLGGRHEEVNATHCCSVTNGTIYMPPDPDAQKLFTWETGIIALGVRLMPQESFLNWVVLQRGPSQVPREEIVGDFWSGRGHRRYGRTRRPRPIMPMFINNMGGWMASRRQIVEWHTHVCPGGYLPPFHPSDYNLDGLDMRNVEYWSGGLSLVTHKHACNLQRIMSLHPDDFSKQLLYHTANNKQRTLAPRRDRFVRANHLLGQLNFVTRLAQRTMDGEQRRQRQNEK